MSPAAHECHDLNFIAFIEWGVIFHGAHKSAVDFDGDLIRAQLIFGQQRINIAAGRQLAILAVHSDAHIISLGGLRNLVKDFSISRISQAKNIFFGGFPL
jgi:hypothetical protein